MTNSEGIIAVQQLIARFANSFDLKDWDELGRCLTSRIHSDYSDLRGTPPETISRERYVESRRSALEAVQTHHLSGNVEVDLDDKRAEARVSMVIYRRNADGEMLNTHCLYVLEVERTDRRWSIRSIVQKVFWNEGAKAVHPGIAEDA